MENTVRRLRLIVHHPPFRQSRNITHESDHWGDQHPEYSMLEYVSPWRCAHMHLEIMVYVNGTCSPFWGPSAVALTPLIADSADHFPV